METKQPNPTAADLDRIHAVRTLSQMIGSGLEAAANLAREVVAALDGIEADLKAGVDFRPRLTALREETVSPLIEEREAPKYVELGDAAEAMLEAAGVETERAYSSTFKTLIDLLPEGHVLRGTDLETFGGSEPVAIKFKGNLYVHAADVGYDRGSEAVRS